MSYAEIAQHLQVSKTSVVSDMHHIREHAKQSIKEYTTQHLPEQYQVCLSALDTILKNTFVILQNRKTTEKLAAMQLFKDTHITKLELLSNATTIDSALQFIRSKHQSQQNKKDSDDGDSSDSQITTTTTGVQTVF